MKKLILLFLLPLLLGLFPGCAAPAAADIAATTLPVYEFTLALCQGTDLTVTRLVTENVSCLHDYTLQVRQMQAIQSAGIVVISGAGLEDFLDDALHDAQHIADASQGLALLEGPAHSHDHEHGHGEAHTHAEDPHIWLSPVNAKHMARNICQSLQTLYPQYHDIFESNLATLCAQLDALQAYGEQALSQLSCRELVTFHDGFSYLAESFGLTILEAVEEEAGSEASAARLIGLSRLVRAHGLPAVFIEANGADSAARVIATETGVQIFTLDMAMSGDSYFDAMYHNVDTLREALQ